MSPRVEVFELVTKGRWPTAVADLAPLRVETTRYDGRYRIFIETAEGQAAARAELHATLDRVRPGWDAGMYVTDMT